jgi:hypothetical protein
MSLVATRRCTGIDVPTSETDSYLSPPPFLFPLPQQPSLKGGGGGGGSQSRAEGGGDACFSTSWARGGEFV